VRILWIIEKKSTFPSLISPLYSLYGGVAQLGERVLCKHEVIGSIPFTSTIRWTIKELCVGFEKKI
jgi:hypothetical protein